MRYVACLLILFAPAVHAQQMYKCTEAGKTRYSDKPITDCRSATTLAAPPSAPSTGKAPPPRRPESPLKKSKSAKGSSPQAKGSQAGQAKKAAPPAPQQTAKASQTAHDKKYAEAQCRELREEEAWLRSPRGAKVERRDERLGQVRQALSGCR